ncbi:MAG: hypothetical protein IKV35_02165, partial [Clostridia bacterium]|nr:hypothetical protein [Clostridia bacterium]
MTNRQHEEDDLIFSIDPSIHDKHTKLSAHDLHLTPEQPHEKRDKIDVPQPDAPELLLSPPPRHRHHGAEQKPKKRRTKKQILLLILLIFLGVIVGIGLIAGITYAILY